MHPADKAEMAAFVTVVVSAVFVALTFIGCYDANSPNLPPCDASAGGYTGTDGCFTQRRPADGGPDAR